MDSLYGFLEKIKFFLFPTFQLAKKSPFHILALDSKTYEYTRNST